MPKFADNIKTCKATIGDMYDNRAFVLGKLHLEPSHSSQN